MEVGTRVQIDCPGMTIFEGSGSPLHLHGLYGVVVHQEEDTGLHHIRLDMGPTVRLPAKHVEEPPEEHPLRTPREIAQTAVNHLCAYDAENDPLDWQTTAGRVAEFHREFALMAAERLASVARRAR